MIRWPPVPGSGDSLHVFRSAAEHLISAPPVSASDPGSDQALVLQCGHTIASLVSPGHRKARVNSLPQTQERAFIKCKFQARFSVKYTTLRALISLKRGIIEGIYSTFRQFEPPDLKNVIFFGRILTPDYRRGPSAGCQDSVWGECWAPAACPLSRL